MVFEYTDQIPPSPPFTKGGTAPQTQAVGSPLCKRGGRGDFSRLLNIHHLFAILLACLTTFSPAHAAEVQLHQQLQALPIAGFQYYAGQRNWDQLKIGDPLKLIREADNPHDPNAVRVEWNGEKLGYVPRAGNDTVAKLLDKGVPVSGRITYLHKGRSAWQRIQFEVLLDQ